MLKKSVRFYVGIVLILLGLICLVEFLNNPEFNMLVFFFVSFIAGVVLLIIDKAMASLDASVSYNKEEVPDSFSINYNLFEDVVNNMVLRYTYEENIFLCDGGIDNIVGNEKEDLVFKQEPDNPYDAKAVAIYLKNSKIGYVYRGRVQDMINDWIKRGEEFAGYICKYSLKDKKASYRIGFYKPLDIYKSQVFNIYSEKYVDPGESVIINYDGNNYDVYHSFDKLGTLPTSANKFIESFQPVKIVGLVTANDVFDIGNLGVDKSMLNITVYPIR